MLKVSHRIKKSYISNYEQLPTYIKSAIKKTEGLSFENIPGGIAVLLRPEPHYYNDLLPIFKVGSEKLFYISAENGRLRFAFSL